MPVTVSEQGIARTMNNLSRGAASIRAGLPQAVEREMIDMQEDIRRNGMTGTKGFDPFWGVTGASGNTLGARSGKSRESIVTRTFTIANEVIGSVGSPRVHLRVLEEGGRITSSGKMFRIPTAAAMRENSGTPRFSGSAQDIPGTFLLKSANKMNTWIARMVAGRLELLFLLRRSITLKGHHVFREAKKRNEPGAVARIRAFAAKVSVEMGGA